MYRHHRLREIGLRRGVSRDKYGLRRGLAELNRTWTIDPCTPCLKFCTPTFKILPNSLIGSNIIGCYNKEGNSVRVFMRMCAHARACLCMHPYMSVYAPMCMRECVYASLQGSKQCQSLCPRLAKISPDSQMSVHGCSADKSIIFIATLNYAY